MEMKRVCFLLTALLLLSLSSCKRLSVMKEMKNVIGSTVTLPDNMELFKGLPKYDNSSTPKSSIIVWYDSTMCSACKLSGMDNLDGLEAFCHDSLKDVNVNIIFSPLSKTSDPFREAIIRTEHNYPIYLDSCQSFFEANPQLPSSFYLHTLLLDKDNKVVLCGDPIPNRSMWEAYKKHLRLLTQD